MKKIFTWLIICTFLNGCKKDQKKDRPNSSAITICNQTWMVENLDVSNYRNGDPIPQVKDQQTWVDLTTSAWCWYNNDSAKYGSIYGKLYNWYAVNDPRGLAPKG
ncbi:MAG TPA: FISUMP domain-containing protein, partial [Flavisolibacter sp.]|nr:FISUMP domain-containing protein [Flavisolibacter sp.]